VEQPHQIPVCYFPGTHLPVPPVMTPAEVVRLLRIDQTGTKDPIRTLDYYRKRGLLRAIQVGRSLCYRLEDVLDFLQRVGEVNPR